VQTNDYADDMSAIQAQCDAECKAECEKNNAIIGQVKAKVSRRVFKDIKTFMDDSGSVYGFCIKKEPVGCEQQYDYSFGKYYVNQTCNGGYSGDSYAGTVSINIGINEWFQFSYSM